jgi:hypothetical protein
MSRSVSVLVAFGLILSFAGCGSSTAAHAPKATRVLGPGPWEAEDVTTFVRPAYEALVPKLGELLSFTCSPGVPDGAGLADLPAGQTFLCVAVFGHGASNGRVFVFDERGAVVREAELPDSVSVNLGVECVARAAPGVDTPACDRLPVELEPGPLPPLDVSLYGRDGPPLPGQPGHPAECGDVGGEPVTAVKHDCAEARRVADVIVRTESCKPKPGARELNCRLENYYCALAANSDPTRPWSGGCSTVPPAAETEDSDSIDLYVPAPAPEER